MGGKLVIWDQRKSAHKKGGEGGVSGNAERGVGGQNAGREEARKRHVRSFAKKSEGGGERKKHRLVKRNNYETRGD